MAEEKTVRVRWLRAMKGFKVGHQSEEKDTDVRFWVKEKWVVKAELEKKAQSEPPKDKTIKAAEVKK